MKGIALPINTIVVVAIAVLVLVVLAAFFTGFISLQFGTINHQEAWTRGCGQATARGCLESDFANGGFPITGYDPDGDDTEDDLFKACQNVFGTTSADECRTNCCGGA